jgi:N-acetylmuramoyl-L-alanine amidase
MMHLLRTTSGCIVFALAVLGSMPLAQGPAPSPLTLITAQGRRPLPTIAINGQEMVAVDDLVSFLQVAAREDTAAGGLAISYKGRTVIVSPDQPMASVSGRLIPLPAPALRNGRRWFVPIDLLTRALAPIYDARIEFRRPSRLVIVGDLRVPRVTVRLDSIGPPTRLSVEASPSTLITPVIEPGRVILRLDAHALDLAPLPQGGGLIEQARIDGNTVVVTLSARAGQARAAQAGTSEASRVNVDVPAGQVDAALPLPAPPVTEVEEASPPAAAAATRVVVIDPGHGGPDIGVTGQGGAQEKQLVLSIARRAKVLIESRLGVRVLLTRDDDSNPTLDARTALANNNNADLFISVHLNGSLSPMASGAEVYQLRLPTAPSGQPIEVPAPLSLPLTSGGTRAIALVPWDLAQIRHREDSTLLANLLESALRAHIPMSTRPMQDAPLRILAGLDTAAATVELGYLSNAEQEAAAQSDLFQGRAAQALLEAVTAFRAAWKGEQ